MRALPTAEAHPLVSVCCWTPSLERLTHRLECNYQDIIQVFQHHILYGPDDLENHKSKILGFHGRKRSFSASLHFTFFGNYTDMS